MTVDSCSGEHDSRQRNSAQAKGNLHNGTGLVCVDTMDMSAMRMRCDSQGLSELNPHATAFVPRHTASSNAARHNRSSKSNNDRRVANNNKQRNNQNKAAKATSQDSRPKSTDADNPENSSPKPQHEVKARRFNILVPDTTNSQSNKGEVRGTERKIWFDEDPESGGQCGMTSNDPAFNRDLKRGERFAVIPPTANEREEIEFLRMKLEEATQIWDDDDIFLEHAIERHRLAQVTHVKPLPSGLNQLEMGVYRGLFTLPWMMQVRRDFPDDAMKAKLALARATCLRGLTEENLDPEKGDVPLCLVNWGLLQDPNAAKRRQKEKQEEEKWQENTREVWMHQVVAEGIYEHQSQTLYPREYGPPKAGISEALDKWDYGSYMYHQQSARIEEQMLDGSAEQKAEKSDAANDKSLKSKPRKSRMRPIVKTTHLNSSSDDSSFGSPPSPELDFNANIINLSTEHKSNPIMIPNLPVCAVRPSYRIKSTARNLRPIEAL